MTRRTAVFSSVLAPLLARYVNLKQTLGRSFDHAIHTLESVDRFLHKQAQEYSDLNAAAFQAWCQIQEHVTSGGRRRRMQEVYSFCLYRRRTEPQCFVPDPALFPKPDPRFQPYVFFRGGSRETVASGFGIGASAALAASPGSISTGDRALVHDGNPKG